MRLGLSSAAFYGRLETEDAAGILKTYPLDTCEIFLETPSEYIAAFGALVKQRLGDLPCQSIHAKGTQFEGDLFGASSRQAGDAFKTLQGVLDCGQALGAKVYVFHGQPDYRGGLTPARISRLSATVHRILDMAEERGIAMAWENVSWCALKHPEDAAYLREAFPRLSFVLDIKQAIQTKTDPFAFLPAMGEKLAHVHVLDYDKEGRLCLPGQGVFDFPRFFQALAGQGYRGDIILEPYAAQAAEDGALRRSIAYLREAMAG